VSYCTDKYELSHTHKTSLIKDSLMTAARDRPHTHSERKDKRGFIISHCKHNKL